MIMQNKTLLNSEQIKKIIAAHPFFSLLSAKDIAELEKLMAIDSIKSGEVVVHEGDIVDKVYLIAQGDAEVTKKIVTKERDVVLPLKTLHPGEAIGLSEAGLFSKEGRRMATVTALSDMTLLHANIDELDTFIQTRIDLYPDFKKALEKNLKMNFIKNIAPSGLLQVDDIVWLVGHLQTQDATAGTIIFNQGEVGNKAYLIQSGKIEILPAAVQGNSNEKVVLQAPEIFGETALITGAPRNATVRVLEDCRLLIADRDLLDKIMDRNKNVSTLLRKVALRHSVPTSKESVTVVQDKTRDGNMLVTLQGKSRGSYCRLSEQGWLVWQQINGQRSLADIINNTRKQLGENAEEVVHKTLIILIHANLVEIPGFDKSALNKNSSWWQSLKNKLFK